MLAKDWMAQVRRDADALRSLIARWHPSSGRLRGRLRITAPTAEGACESVRRKIKSDEEGERDPIERFDEALAASDAGRISALLSGAWFGVPESTECWNERGFSEACNLMEDPPGNDEEIVRET